MISGELITNTGIGWKYSQSEKPHYKCVFIKAGPVVFIAHLWKRTEIDRPFCGKRFCPYSKAISFQSSVEHPLLPNTFLMVRPEEHIRL